SRARGVDAAVPLARQPRPALPRGVVGALPLRPRPDEAGSTESERLELRKTATRLQCNLVAAVRQSACGREVSVRALRVRRVPKTATRWRSNLVADAQSASVEIGAACDASYVDNASSCCSVTATSPSP